MKVQKHSTGSFSLFQTKIILQIFIRKTFAWKWNKLEKIYQKTKKKVLNFSSFFLFWTIMLIYIYKISNYKQHNFPASFILFVSHTRGIHRERGFVTWVWSVCMCAFYCACVLSEISRNANFFFIVNGELFINKNRKIQ